MAIFTITLLYFANRFASDSSLSYNLLFITHLFSPSSIVSVSDSPPSSPSSPEILQPPLSPSPPEGIVRTGTVDDNGLMSLEFEIGEVIDLEDDLEEEERDEEIVRVKVGKFGV
ncbi:LOW QUALITY PROTEIN: hypothetical protein RJ641_029479 [Dillenia turbinata]|uniref:Uncharacterized protein n=1 Tax=Dillenia turbinata TaxID=194707 RepID=A0AAN8ZMR6_9MAGN